MARIPTFVQRILARIKTVEDADNELSVLNLDNPDEKYAAHCVMEKRAKLEFNARPVIDLTGKHKS